MKYRERKLSWTTGILASVLFAVALALTWNFANRSPISTNTRTAQNNRHSITRVSPTINRKLTLTVIAPLSTPQTLLMGHASTSASPVTVKLYVVQQDDTLLKIVDDYNIGELRRLNHVATDFIRVGEILSIPRRIPSDSIQQSSTSTTPIQKQGKTYAVQMGDTLSLIAYNYSVSVEDIAAANGISKTSTIYVGQILTIPTNQVNVRAIPRASQWQPSIIEGNLNIAYPRTHVTERFLVHYTPNTYSAATITDVVAMLHRALTHIEDTFDARLEGRFDVYVAGSLFASPNQALRGRSFSAARYFFFLHDGSGNRADQQYIATHEMVHLFTWNVFGRPVSAMLSEGAAVYAGMLLIGNSDHMPLKTFCGSYHRAEQLPRVSTNLRFEGHIRNLENYYTAGCFVGYLVEKYGPSRFGRLYSTGNYSGVYGKSLTELETEWLAELDSTSSDLAVQPEALINTVEEVKIAYDQLFTGFNGSPESLKAYKTIDSARIAMLEGRFEDAKLGDAD